jgi:outer membrane protein assembly factor BamA
MRRLGGLATLLVVLAACGGAATSPRANQPVAPKSVPVQAPVDIAWDKLEGPIQNIEFRFGVDAVRLADKIGELLAPAVGKPLDRAALRELTSQMFKFPGVGDVTVRGIQRAEGITLELEITPQPTVHALTATLADGTAVSPPGPLATAVGRPLDPVVLDTAARGLRDAFTDDGCPEAAARWSTRPAGSQVDVALVVTPGTKVVIERVELAGNAHAKTTELLKRMDLRPGPWNQDHVDRATLQITAYYYDHGYVNVTVDTPAPSATPKFTIKEGDQFKIGKLSIKDATPADEKKWLAVVGLKKGDVFDRSAMDAGIQKLYGATSAVNINPATTVDPAKKTIDISFELGYARRSN